MVEYHDVAAGDVFISTSKKERIICTIIAVDGIACSFITNHNFELLYNFSAFRKNDWHRITKG